MELSKPCGYFFKSLSLNINGLFAAHNANAIKRKRSVVTRSFFTPMCIMLYGLCAGYQVNI